MTDDKKQRQQPETWYAVVKVIGVENGRGKAEFESFHEDFDSAEKHAAVRRHHVALDEPFIGRKPEVREEYRFEIGPEPLPAATRKLVQELREIRWQRESRDPVLVCRMEGRNGVPRKDMEVKFDIGRDEFGRATERTAVPLQPRWRDARSDETYYVPVERRPGIGREGKALGVYGTRAEASRHARQRCREIEQRNQDSGPDALKKASLPKPPDIPR